MTRRQARETALKVLFQVDIGKIEVDEAMKFMLAEDDSASEIDVSFLKRLVEGTAA
ncbi:MAG TPA: N utilization substance protein B, partial [Firmicutes bacterium]|nr:N utilization substance protein B [Bacillota bacterium]